VTAAAVVLAVVAIGLAGAGWRADAGTRQQRLLAVAMGVALAAVAVLVLVAGPAGAWGPAASRTLLVLFGALAVAGGGPVAVAVLSVADRPPALVRVGAVGDAEHPDEPERPDGLRQPDEFQQLEESEQREEGEVLRGGAWIGSLERLGIFASLVAGWPGGVAVVLAVKGVGRYQELGEAGAAERFIIGTFASVLWAGACAGVWWYG
jgi:hypothetical protein